MAVGLLLATLTSAMFRAWGSGVDVSTVGWGQAVGVGLALMGGWLWWKGEGARSGLGVGLGEGADEAGAGAFWRVALLSLGLMAVFTLIYFAFAAPHVMARWTGIDALAVLGVLLVAWSAFALGMAWRPGLFHFSPPWLLAWNALFAIALFLSVRGQQTVFPASPEAYPILARPPIIGSKAAFFLMLLLSPVLLVDFQRQLDTMKALRPSVRQSGGAFDIAALFLLLAIFAHVFTTVYDYIPVVGPFFRDAFAWVYLSVALALILGAAAARRPSEAPSPVAQTAGWIALSLVLLTLGAHFLTTARPAAAPPADAITILTYNIQQGYSDAGRKNYHGQLAQIQAIAPDIIGLQESDTARIANSNDDVVRFFADHLDMYSYYGPKSVDGTFGIALLSRFPIQNPTTFYLYSEGEQVAAIRADVEVGEARLTVFVTHLGNGGPMIQQQQFLQIVSGTPRAVALGDFNFRPDSDQYALTTQTLLDSWTVAWPDWRDDRGQEPRDKIDHIFITPDLRVLDADYYPEGPSDHPAVTATLGW
jgi:endonuclease/exonuclease/phosphatase family metal-dependent hydrolase